MKMLHTIHNGKREAIALSQITAIHDSYVDEKKATIECGAFTYFTDESFDVIIAKLEKLGAE